MSLIAKGKAGEAAWIIEPRFIPMGRIVAGEEHYELVCPYSPNEDGWRVAASESDIDGLSIECVEVDPNVIGAVLAGSSQRVSTVAHARLFRIRVVPSGEGPNVKRGTLRLLLEGTSLKTLSIPVSAEIVSAVRAFPSTLAIKNADGKVVDRAITLVSMTGNDFEVLSADVGDIGLSCSYPNGLSKKTVVRLSGDIQMGEKRSGVVKIRMKMKGQIHVLEVPVTFLM